MSGTDFLLIDLDKCFGCSRCADTVPGIYRVIEDGIRKLICRRCQNPPCVAACPVEALEKPGEGDLKRHTFICVSCKQCASACPVGANPPAILSYKNYPLHGIDFQRCLRVCRKGAVQIKDKIPPEYTPWGKSFAFKAREWRK